MEIISYSPMGYSGQLVRVEVDIRVGIPGTDIIGLPASEVREATERVRVSLRNSGFTYPASRILINLSPADVPKSGNGFDLGIALSVLEHSEQVDGADPSRLLVLGELHLDGTVGGVRGAISAVAEAAADGVRHFIVPWENQRESVAVGVGRVAVIRHLAQLPRLLRELGGTACGTGPQAAGFRGMGLPGRDSRDPVDAARPAGDYIHLRGNGVFKRALTIAAAGGHHLIAVGPPGVGKSMGISLLPTILPRLRRNEALEVTRIHSLAGETAPRDGLLWRKPFRSPHHNSSAEGLLGGGRTVMPGEVSLAHRGVLFLDEALEFNRPSLQGLREPLERHSVRMSRAGRTYWFPADFQLLMAANPCPCGQLGRNDRDCLCSVAEVERYWRRIGGPLLDRIDLRVAIASRDIDSLPAGDASADMRVLIDRALARQRERAPGAGAARNAMLVVEKLFPVMNMTERARSTYSSACTTLRLSGRASVSVGRVARTIADLEGAERVAEDHVLEAIAHRRNGEDRELWHAV